MAALFHNHDRVHVVFGLSTELRHEVLVDNDDHLDRPLTEIRNEFGIELVA